MLMGVGVLIGGVFRAVWLAVGVFSLCVVATGEAFRFGSGGFVGRCMPAGGV